MTPRVLRADGRRAVPWKNGGGTTREVAIAPDGAGTDDFDWRISLADVGVDGPFSAFPGVERILTVADGAGMELTVGGERTVADRRYRPYAFPGDVPTDGRLLGGPVVNFNVMYRRDRIACRTSVVRGEAAPEVPPGSTVVVVALDGTTAVGDAGPTLERYDAVLLDGPPGPLRTEGHAAVVVLRSL
ncbi:HutD family protein [Streptomyces sp. AM8-1-1]|uniref:HutD/Ves family protein n=1 Tax=Streptomyces sp. AM8-1-1 TaxID=3075825 RepID=UPI0028C4DBE7|nr:HutD family protein [Streptomyces sp. AM8-1-1]WNO75173.1 HutD family protein [Streptomyces sp. AM8-1-1]